MNSLNMSQAESYSKEDFHCGACNRDFAAQVITWIDVSRTPQVKKLLLRWQFNTVQCPSCGCRQIAETPFFYEDFEEGLLIAVFPRIPDGRGALEASIREKYSYYPVLEFFYDLAQIWTLLYLQEHYRSNRNLRMLSRLGSGEEGLRKMLRFLKEDSLMIDIREKLTESFFGDSTEDELTDLLSQAVYTVEEMLPWPQDRKCICGSDLTAQFKCCGRQVELDEHDERLSRHYVVYCPSCSESLAGAACEMCGRVYTWKLGIVQTYKEGAAKKKSPKKKENHSPVKRTSKISQLDH
jgi:hypothetical protein